MVNAVSRVLVGSLVVFCALTIPIEGQSSFFQIPSPWTWECNKSACVKTSASSSQNGTSFATCKLTCYESGILWPKPVSVALSKNVVTFNSGNIQFTNIAIPQQARSLLNDAADIFLNQIRRMESTGVNGSSCIANGKACSAPYASIDQQLNIEVFVTQDVVRLITTTDESYTLAVKTDKSVTTVNIVAETFFGARHAMETLSQLIIWDDVIGSLIMNNDANISDKPVFPHRGLSIDCSRTYFSLDILKRIIDGMSYNKLNVLHWHLLDTHSFPFVSTREPLMAIYGAYSTRQVYRPQDIQDLVQYGQVRGVKIIPELDGPAHIGAGWEWGPQYGLGDLILCHNIQPWDQYCAEPPCGIMNPVNDNMYKVMNNIYKDMSELFQSDIFHIGGDELNFRCWNETDEILSFMTGKGWDRNSSGFFQMWNYFQTRSLEELDAAFGYKQDVMFWSSDLTYEGRAGEFLDKERYIIQFWDNWNDTNTKILIEQGFRLIMSNSDVLYLDCGYSAWVGSGTHNWCAPYKGWQLIYGNSPRQMVENFGLDYATHSKQFLGGEAAMWSEQVEGLAIETKLWPRSSALAERLWTDPVTTWREAEVRMLAQRERMVERGILADSIEPLYCYQNEGACFLA